MNIHTERSGAHRVRSDLIEECRDTQVQHVLRILQDPWAQLASDLAMLEPEPGLQRG